MALGNAIAILCINQQHHRKPFTDSRTLVTRYVAISATLGAALFLFVGTVTGFLPDIAVPLSNASNTTFPAFTAALWSAAAAIAFGILSYSHAGIVHASLCFRRSCGPWSAFLA